MRVGGVKGSFTVVTGWFYGNGFEVDEVVLGVLAGGGLGGGPPVY